MTAISDNNNVSQDGESPRMKMKSGEECVSNLMITSFENVKIFPEIMLKRQMEMTKKGT